MTDTMEAGTEVKPALTFKAVNRDEIPASTRPGRSGGVTAQLFSDFLESGLDIAQIDVDADDVANKRAGLSAYLARHQDRFIAEHETGVWLFVRSGNLYIERVTPDEAQKRTARAQEIAAKRAATKAAAEAVAGAADEDDDDDLED